MGFFKREKPIHEQLAREGGLDYARDVEDIAAPPKIHPEHPIWSIAGIHGIPQAREWDAVATAVAPELPGEEVDFVALHDGTLFAEQELPDDALDPLADAIEMSIAAPYHAVGRRQEGNVWGVAAMLVDVVEVTEDVPGDKVELAVHEGEVTIRVDGEETAQEIPSLQDFGAAESDSFVLRASRLDETLWEVTVLPL